MGSMETRIREWAGSTFTPARSVTDAGYLIDPVFYSVIEFSRRLESGSAEVCSTACRSACITECGPALSTGGEPTGEQRRCLDASPVPSFVHTNTNACRSIIGGGALASTLLSTTTGPTPRCSVADTSADTPLTGGAAAAGGTCNPPVVPEGAVQKKCVFYCMQPGTGRAGDGRATIEEGETSNGQRCLNVNVVRRVGTRACSSAGECACVDECKSVCGSEGGKSKCFIAPNSPDQILACSGAGNIGQARAPVCVVDEQAGASGSPTTLTNPLGTTDIGELIARFIRALSGIAGSMALLMFVVGGVMWMTAEGSDRVQTAQTILKNASIGMVLIFFAYSIVSLFLTVLGL